MKCKKALLNPCGKCCSMLGSGRQLPAAWLGSAWLGRHHPVKASLRQLGGVNGLSDRDTAKRSCLVCTRKADSVTRTCCVMAGEKKKKRSCDNHLK